MKGDNTTNILGENYTSEERVMKNPWRNAYWFARMLINSDKYGAIGKETKLLAEICAASNKIIEDSHTDNPSKIILIQDTTRELFSKRYVKKTGKTERINLFLDDLFCKIETIDDIIVFLLTAESRFCEQNLKI